MFEADEESRVPSTPVTTPRNLFIPYTSVKNVSVSEIKIINQGDREVEVLTDVIHNVEIVGEASAVEALTGDNIVAEIDMTKVSLAQGQQTVAVDIVIPSTDAVYARGTYYATIKN